MRVKILSVLLALTVLSGCGSTSTTGSGRTPSNPKQAVSDYVQLGLNYLSAGNRDQARFNLLRALNINPRSPLAHNAISLLYQSEGEMELAEQHFQTALKTDRHFTQARNNYARFLFMQDRTAEARDQYKLVTEDVNYRLRPNGFLGLALSEKKLGNRLAAEQALQHSLRLAPQFAVSVLELSRLKYEMLDYVSAKEYLDQFEDISQTTPESLDLGMRLADRFGDKNARVSYEMALKNIYPESRQARELVLAEQANTLE